MAAISEEEKLRRRQGNESILGSWAMEGMTLDATTLALARRFEEGELTREQLGAAIDRHVDAMLRADAPVAGAA
jgi:hypothetical protein